MQRTESSLTRWIAFAALWAVFAAGVHAHDLGRSESVLTVRGSDVQLRLTLNLLEVPAIDRNGDDRVSYGELDEAIDRVYGIVKGYLTIHSNGPPVRSSLERYSVKEEHVGELDLRLTFERRVNQLTVTSTLHQVLRPSHEHLTSVSFEDEGGLKRAMLGPAMPGATFAHGSDPYIATIVLGLLIAGVIGCAFLVQFVRRRVTR